MPERLLHARRRRRALDALRRRPVPAMVLVVCHGNICRSPFAAALLARDVAAADVRVESAGFVGPDRACPREAVVVAARWGVDLSGHRSQLLTPDLARGADLIVVMDPAQGRAICDRFGMSSRAILPLGDLDPLPLATQVILDPVEQGPDVFAKSYQRIERCIGELVAVLSPLERPAVTEGDRRS